MAYIERISALLDAGDWHAAYRWAKGWIGSGGGAALLDPWLVYVGDALTLGQWKSSVHAVDLALQHWISDSLDRGVLRWVRGRLIWIHLSDPKTALADLAAASVQVPGWLTDVASQDLRRCEGDAARSRRRKATVLPAPEFQPSDHAVVSLADRRSPVPAPGTEPVFWHRLLPLLDQKGAPRRSAAAEG